MQVPLSPIYRKKPLSLAPESYSHQAGKPQDRAHSPPPSAATPASGTHITPSHDILASGALLFVQGPHFGGLHVSFAWHAARPPSCSVRHCSRLFEVDCPLAVT